MYDDDKLAHCSGKACVDRQSGEPGTAVVVSTRLGVSGSGATVVAVDWHHKDLKSLCLLRRCGGCS
jgi:hypothetical protein